MKVNVVQGDVFELAADMLICPANPLGNLSGGVSGELLLRGGEDIQRQLHERLVQSGSKNFPPGSIIATSPGPTGYRGVLHAVAIDAFYDTSVELVTQTLETAFRMAGEMEADSVALPAIATGYGRLPIVEFGSAFAQAVRNAAEMQLEVTLALRTEESRTLIENRLNSSGTPYVAEQGDE